MKKTFLWVAAFCAVSALQVQAQEQIEDGAFEYWEEMTITTDEGETAYDLASPFWGTLNMLATLPPDQFTGPLTVFRDAGRSGQAEDYAPRMESNSMVYGNNETIFLPGVVGAFTVITENQTAKFGRPFTSRPVALKGYMKYAPVNGDSASIFVELYKYVEGYGQQKIGRVEQIYKSEVSDWTEFNLPIVYQSDVAPDSVTVLFVSSAGYDFDNLFNCKGQSGSTLWVDDVEFVYEEQATETINPMQAASVYPNPSSNGVFSVQVPAACRADVISLSGQRMMSRSFAHAGEYTLDLSSYVPGMYMLRLQGDQDTTVLKIVRR